MAGIAVLCIESSRDNQVADMQSLRDFFDLVFEALSSGHNGI